MLTMAKLGWGISLIMPVSVIVFGVGVLAGAIFLPLPDGGGHYAVMGIGVACIVIGLAAGAIPFTVLAMLNAQQEGLYLKRQILRALATGNQSSTRVEPIMIGGIQV